MRHNWIKLNREDTQSILGALRDHPDAVVLSDTTTEVVYRDLPFYSRHRLYRMVNYATMPTFTIYYLYDGDNFVSLDGSAQAIYTVNEQDPVKVDATTVLPYLDFFFHYVQGAEGDVVLVRDALHMPFLSALSPEQKKSVADACAPVRIEEKDSLLYIHGTLLYGGTLIESTITVDSAGTLGFENQKMLMSGIYLPRSPYENAWLEGHADDAYTKVG